MTELIIESRAEIAHGVIHLVLRHPDGKPLPPWEPGAHVDVTAGGFVRQYSLCGDPGDPAAYEIAVLREPDGRGGSAHIHDQIRPGDRVTAGEPRNHFPLVDADRYLFVAGGIGITPFLPMIATVAARDADWKLYYGGRTRASMAFADRLARYGPRVELFPEDETGMLDLDTILAETGTLYCCGPPGLLEAVQARTGDRDDVHVERFTPLERPATTTAFEVELAQSGRVLHVPAGQSILAVVREAGIEVLSSCEEGTCGTCETAVLGGVPEHHDTLLTDAEREAGDTMMICVGRSRTPRLVLDL
jgi:ferredoxin-NADP reductase